MKRLSLLLALLAAGVGYAALLRRGDRDADGIPLPRDADGDGVDALVDPDADGDGLANAEDVVRAARALSGGLADPLMGRFGDPLGRIGMRVCTDVALEAWSAAGLPLAELLRERAAHSPGRFAITPENHPSDPFFPRRVRNLRALFAADIPGLGLTSTPRPGDLAFYGDRHVAVVSAVGDHGYTVIEARRLQIAARAGGQVAREVGGTVVFGGLRP